MLGPAPDSVAGTLILCCAAQYIDNATMALHHGVHNKAYVTNANAALAEAPPAAKNLTLLGLNHNVGTGLFSKPALNTAFRCAAACAISAQVLQQMVGCNTSTCL